MQIDRERLVRRHNPALREVDPLSPFTVGNGEFCFTADVTGLQSFPDAYLEGIPLCTLSNWGWHTAPRPTELLGQELRMKQYDTYGRMVSYPTSAEGQRELYDWLRVNPHRLHLGQLGFGISLKDGRSASLGDIHAIDQELDLWTGVLHSRFEVKGVPVTVRTCCHPSRDIVATRIVSELLRSGQISLVIRFPYGSGDMSAADWEQPDRHTTHLSRMAGSHIRILRIVDDQTYFVSLRVPDGTSVRQLDEHTLVLAPPESTSPVEFTCCFSQYPPRESPPPYTSVEDTSVEHWHGFWTDGGAVDLSESTDPAAEELERRIVLSQYLTAIQCSGSIPPQETGLTCNSWYGKFHLEMHWWHSAHFALWGRDHLLERSLWWYESIRDKARRLAASHGYSGARWPKMVGPDGEQSPSPIAPLLIWQQPHPIFMAELCYRARLDRSILEAYSGIVFDTAEFMASFAHLDSLNERYVLGPPVIPAQENHKPEITINPTFELRYWKFGLDVAQRWRERLGLSRNPQWDYVSSRLSRLPVQNGVYLAHENCPDTFESFNYDHPSMLGVYGILPDDELIDVQTMERTLDRAIEDWQWERTWGWDYPMCAMTAARLGRTKTAIDMLMFDSVKNRYLTNGHVWQRPNLPLYLPANGGLLTAVAMMSAGWDGHRGDCTDGAPGFPDDGKWKVVCERILRYV